MGIRGGLVAQVKGQHQGTAHQAGIPDVRQLDQPGAVPEATGEIRPDPDRQAGLAHSSRPDQAEQSRLGELRSDFGKRVPTADEARRFSRQIARSAGRPRPRDQENTTTASYVTGSGFLGTLSVIPRISALRLAPTLGSMTRELPIQRGEVRFV